MPAVAVPTGHAFRATATAFSQGRLAERISSKRRQVEVQVRLIPVRPPATHSGGSSAQNGAPEGAEPVPGTLAQRGPVAGASGRPAGL